MKFFDKVTDLEQVQSAECRVQSGVGILLCICIVLLAGVAFVGCQSAPTAFFNAEKLAVDGATGSMHTYNLYYRQATNAAASDPLKCQKLTQDAQVVWGYGTNFYRTITVVDSLRAAYELNSADTNRTALEAALAALSLQATNIAVIVKSAISRP